MIIELDEHINSSSSLKENTIIGDPILTEESAIQFNGKGNILIIEENATLVGSSIRFCSDNAVVYLSSNNKHVYRLKLDVWRDTTVFFGSDNYFNGPLSAVIAERQNLIVGNDGVFSFGIWLRTADPHIIYDNNSKKRLNMSRSILIGDHVWLGQNALLLKGSMIGSGSIISANCVIAGKKVESNSAYAGNPGKLVKSNIFFSKESVNNYNTTQTIQSMELDVDEWIYMKDDTTLEVETLFTELTRCKGSEERAEIVKQLANQWNQKNRFAIEKQGQTIQKRKKVLKNPFR